MVKRSEPLINVVRLNKPKVLSVPARNHRLGPKGEGSGIGAVESPIADGASPAKRRNLTHPNQVLSWNVLSLSASQRMVIRLGKQAECVLPNNLIKQIRVDRELGITLHVLSRVKIIKLGYHHYADKYNMLKHINDYLKKRRNVPAFESIDLNNLNRVVVRPKRLNSGSENDKEV